MCSSMVRLKTCAIESKVYITHDFFTINSWNFEQDTIFMKINA